MSWLITGTEKLKVVYPDAGIFYDAGNPASYSGSGSSIVDLSGKSWNATLADGVTYSSGNGGYFICNGPLATVPSQVQIASATKLSIFSFVRFTSTSGDGSTIYAGGSNSIADILLARGNNRNIFFQVNNGADGSLSGGTVPDNTWACIAAVYDGSLATATQRCKLYVNALDVSVATSFSFPSSTASSNQNQMIGRYFVGNSWDMKGHFGVFALYPGKALTSPEVASLFDSLRSRFSI